MNAGGSHLPMTPLVTLRRLATEFADDKSAAAT
jgi:hypothetical protein